MEKLFAFIAVLCAFYAVSADASDGAICDKDSAKWGNRCPQWEANGDCTNPRRKVFMAKYCPKSCKLPCKPETTSNPISKPPSPPAFCRDRDRNCRTWKDLGECDSSNPNTKYKMAVYCGVTCDICKAPTADECFDKGANCEQLKKEGKCRSTNPVFEYEVKTNCLVTCSFCVPNEP